MKFALIAALLASQVALAQTYDYSKKWGIGGSYGYNTPIFGNTTNDVADGDETWSFHGRYHFNSADALELAFTRHELSDTAITPQVTDLTYVRRLAPLARFSPIVGAGAGIVDMLNYDPNSWKLGLKLRAGAEYALNHCFNVGFNVDYQHINKMLFADNLPTHNAHILAARVGLTWYFGGNKGAAAAAAAPVAATAMNRDSDGDGVIDSKDKCPNTPAGTAVNAYGCAKAEKASFTLDVKFQTGKSDLDHSYDSDLQSLAAFLKEHSKTKLEIQGHTDNTGAKSLNESLSQLRAESVRNYLVLKQGISEDRITAKGYGSAQPVADNKTAEGRAKNRRVVSVITE